MMLSEGDKNGRRCYGCGQAGHMRGDPTCKVSKDTVWTGAPKAYHEKVQRRLDRETPSGKRMTSDKAGQICNFWSTGDGYCKWADKCKFLHVGSQGGSKRVKGAGGKGFGKGKGRGKGKGKGKGKARRFGNRDNQGTTMIVQKKGEKNNEGSSSSSMMVGEQDGQEAEEELYNLMRGHATLMVTDDVEQDESDVSEEESVGEDKEEDGKDQSSSVVPENIEDLYATYIHDLLPKVTLGCSPYELRTGRKPGDSDLGESSSAVPEWGQDSGSLAPNPNFAPTPWGRFEWGNGAEAQGPEPEPTSWGGSRPQHSPSPSSSHSNSPDQLDSRSQPHKQQSSGRDVDEDSGSEESDGEES
jgi:hypothetical protein